MEKNKPPTNTKAMIHATSLRLGNLILEAGEIKKVYQLSIGGKTYDSINNMRVNRETGLIDNGEDIFQPIPLTGEWLEDFGFDFITWNGSVRQYFKSITVSERCILSFRFGEFIGHPNRLDTVSIGPAPHESGSVYGRIPVQYVHQLQNLFFALTGEELTIKEKV